MICPECHGTGKLNFPFFVREEQIKYEKNAIPCDFCNGKKQVSEEVNQWMVGGHLLKYIRISKRMTLRDASRFLKMDVGILSKMERGAIKPDLSLYYFKIIGFNKNTKGIIFFFLNKYQGEIMKIYTTNSESQLNLTARMIERLRRLAMRRKDHNGRNLDWLEKYFLRHKGSGGKKGIFFGGGSLHGPEFVELPSEAVLFTGGQLEDMGYDWTKEWSAIRDLALEKIDVKKPLEINYTNSVNSTNSKVNKKASKPSRYSYQLTFMQSHPTGLQFRILKFDGDSDQAGVGDIVFIMPWKYCQNQDKKLLTLIDKRGAITFDEAINAFYTVYGPSKPENIKKLVDKTKKYKVAQTNFQNTQNTDPEAPDFMVPLDGKHKSLTNGIKGRANRAIHDLGNYHEQIPLTEIFNILKEQKVIVLQEDGTKWSGMIGSQGECGSDKATKQGSMHFELAWLPEGSAEYVVANNYLIMAVCTMESNRLEVIAYIS